MLRSFCRALQAGEKEPILKAHVLYDEVEKLAEEKRRPELLDSGFARLLKVASTTFKQPLHSCRDRL